MASNTKDSEALAGTGTTDANRLGALGRAYSVSILGAIAKAFAPGDFLGTRTAKRVFAGDTTTDSHRTNVFEDVAAVLVDAGVVTTSDLLRREDVSRALEEAALRWDETVATLQSRPGHSVKALLKARSDSRWSTSRFGRSPCCGSEDVSRRN